jgi:hypothetical protein
MRIYALTIFLSAFLLFQVEPIIAKYILPWFGGGASVWTACLLFFQLLLLAGYLYAHLVGSRLRARSQVMVHLALVAGCGALMGVLATIWTSPIMPNASWRPRTTEFPILQILQTLVVSVGLPYFVLATTAPLLQSWFARTTTASPYRLYSLSNLGALLALFTYPFVIEPALHLKTQGVIWPALYVFFAIGISLCALGLWKSQRDTEIFASERPNYDGVDRASRSVATYVLWILLAACPSLALIGSTNQMTQDIAPIPFLWVLPLGLYLISFIICFDNEQWYRREIFLPAFAIAIFFFIILAEGDSAIASLSRVDVFFLAARRNLVVQVVTACALLFTACMVCHGELVRMRPHQRHLTAFYLMVSIGGAVGGVIGAVIAPLLFRGYWELRLAISAATVLAFIVLMRDRHSLIHQPHAASEITLLLAFLVLPQLMGIGFADGLANLPQLTVIGAMIVLIALRNRVEFLSRPGARIQFATLAAVFMVAGVAVTTSIAAYRSAAMTTRNFYGLFRVVSNQSPDPQFRSYALWSGRIMHGEQFLNPRMRYVPVAYYGPESGIGLLLNNHPNRSAPDPDAWALRIGVVGLGTGTVAAWGRLGDYIRYYEINPAIVAMSRGTDAWFTYVGDSSAKVDIILGDGRLSMEREIAAGHVQNFDVLAVDAFSGDAIPIHLLTRQAMEIYLRELKPDGVLALHITNRFLDLAPLAQQLAHAFNLHGGMVIDHPEHLIYADSVWVLLSRSAAAFSAPDIASHLQPLDAQRKVRLWTDDYSNLFQLLR